MLKKSYADCGQRQKYVKDKKLSKQLKPLSLSAQNKEILLQQAPIPKQYCS